MEVALIGMSQSGKSTLFKAVSEGHMQHEGHGGVAQTLKTVVKVPDVRLEKLTQMYHPKKTTHATIRFADLPGLNFIEESSRQEARRILADARQADMLVLVLRGFQSASVMPYRDRVNPQADFEELQTEMLLADLEMITNRIEKLKVNVTKPTKNLEQDKRELHLMEKCAAAVDQLQPISTVVENEEQEKMVRSFGFLTLKPLSVVVNIGEDQLASAETVKIEGTHDGVIALSASIEAELAALPPEERQDFLKEMGISEIAKDRLVQQCYRTMKLISFLTVGEDEVRAWTIPSGCNAVDAAGEIHSDIQRGFIRAETVSYNDLMAAGDMKGVKAAGKMRLEGKTYMVQDGDIINFRFNV